MTPLKRGQLMTEDDYLAKVEEFGDDFSAAMGAEGVRELLRNLDLKHEIETLRERARGDELRHEDQEDRQAPEGARSLPEIGHQARLDDHGSAAGAAAGAASAGAARRRPLRNFGSERSLPPRDQPQQPAEAPARAESARDHRAQREADAPGSGRFAARQRPPRQGDDRRQQAPAQVARGHDQGQRRPFPPEPARQARRLLGPLGDRGRSAAQAAPVRPAEENGARALQAVHLQQARSDGPRDDDQGREAHGRERRSRSCGTSSKR